MKYTKLIFICLANFLIQTSAFKLFANRVRQPKHLDQSIIENDKSRGNEIDIMPAAKINKDYELIEEKYLKDNFNMDASNSRKVSKSKHEQHFFDNFDWNYRRYMRPSEQVYFEYLYLHTIAPETVSVSVREVQPIGKVVAENFTSSENATTTKPSSKTLGTLTQERKQDKEVSKNLINSNGNSTDENDTSALLSNEHEDVLKVEPSVLNSDTNITDSGDKKISDIDILTTTSIMPSALPVFVERTTTQPIIITTITSAMPKLTSFSSIDQPVATTISSNTIENPHVEVFSTTPPPPTTTNSKTSESATLIFEKPLEFPVKPLPVKTASSTDSTTNFLSTIITESKKSSSLTTTVPVTTTTSKNLFLDKKGTNQPTPATTESTTVGVGGPIFTISRMESLLTSLPTSTAVTKITTEIIPTTISTTPLSRASLSMPEPNFNRVPISTVSSITSEEQVTSEPVIPVAIATDLFETPISKNSAEMLIPTATLATSTKLPMTTAASVNSVIAKSTTVKVTDPTFASTATTITVKPEPIVKQALGPAVPTGFSPTTSTIPMTSTAAQFENLPLASTTLLSTSTSVIPATNFLLRDQREDPNKLYTTKTTITDWTAIPPMEPTITTIMSQKKDPITSETFVTTFKEEVEEPVLDISSTQVEEIPLEIPIITTSERSIAVNFDNQMTTESSTILGVYPIKSTIPPKMDHEAIITTATITTEEAKEQVSSTSYLSVTKLTTAITEDLKVLETSTTSSSASLALPTVPISVSHNHQEHGNRKKVSENNITTTALPEQVKPVALNNRDANEPTTTKMSVPIVTTSSSTEHRSADKHKSSISLLSINPKLDSPKPLVSILSPTNHTSDSSINVLTFNAEPSTLDNPTTKIPPQSKPILQLSPLVNNPISSKRSSNALPSHTSMPEKSIVKLPDPTQSALPYVSQAPFPKPPARPDAEAMLSTSPYPSYTTTTPEATPSTKAAQPSKRDRRKKNSLLDRLGLKIRL